MTELFNFIILIAILKIRSISDPCLTVNYRLKSDTTFAFRKYIYI